MALLHDVGGHVPRHGLQQLVALHQRAGPKFERQQFCVLAQNSHQLVHSPCIYMDPHRTKTLPQ